VGSDRKRLGLLEVATSREIVTSSLDRFRTATLLTLGAVLLVVLIVSLFQGRYQVRLEENVAARTADVAATRDRLQDMYLGHDRSLRRMIALRRDGLEPLVEALRPLKSQTGGGPAGDRLRTTERLIRQVIADLEPIARLGEAASQLRDKHVLLAASDKRLRRLARAALLGTGVSIDCTDGRGDVGKLTARRRYDVVCTDGDHLDEVGQIEDPRLDIVYIAMGTDGASLATLAAQPRISNVVSYDLADVASTVRSIHTTVSKIVTRDVFGLQKYLSWGVEVHEMEVKSSTGRATALAELAKRLARLGVRRRFSDVAIQAVEEMLMNAIYDAPTDEQGKPLFNHLARTQAVELPGDDVTRVRFASDGLTLAISVEDPYGSLERQTILDYLVGQHVAEGQAGKGGAGQGLHMLNEIAELVVFNVQRSVRTEVIAFFDLVAAPGGRSARAFHYFGT